MSYKYGYIKSPVPARTYKMCAFGGSLLSGFLSMFWCMYFFHEFDLGAVYAGILLISTVVQYPFFRHGLYKVWEKENKIGRA